MSSRPSSLPFLSLFSLPYLLPLSTLFIPPLMTYAKDIGITTYLMLLWKDTFSSPGYQEQGGEYDYTEGKAPWKAWPRPPGGFLDLGCGLLTHILVSEGYEGYSIDLRARSSWEGYSEETQAQLKVVAVDLTVIPSTHRSRGDFVNGTTEEARGMKTEDEQREKKEELGLGAPGEKSAYTTYRLWLARLSVHCEWLVEADTLRIPSTRNWGVVGRK
ncbi:hypothetical protein BDQ17DRAFT_1519018 [Cyathus striatus]|nr:hypothetical protein BDQ17DRAFT_1519018 [Cyathus striatus]